MAADRTIRILIADDDPIIRNGLSDLLNAESGLEVVATAENGAQVIEALALHRVDMVLLDVDMPGMNGIEVARRLSKTNTSVTIIILTAFEFEDSLGQALALDVRGFLTKDVPAPQLANLLRRAYSGQRVISERPTEMLTAAFARTQMRREEYADFIAAVDSLPNHLVPTFRLLLKAIANKNIARMTGLKESTVKSYTSEIYARTGCATRGELAITAAKAGIDLD
ncbi:MAG: response regulator transcription factor [Actinomycetaceae bacterium]|nr:response regulator transcription factor [Arcanobacterium sp.]MDD7504496.1 response regulator transcription factor [Actinomycetaceae bacterium]